VRNNKYNAIYDDKRKRREIFDEEFDHHHHTVHKQERIITFFLLRLQNLQRFIDGRQQRLYSVQAV
jgi:butyrate kinase